MAPDPLLAEEALVARLLAPLSQLEPARWPGPPAHPAAPRRRRRRGRARPAALRRLALVALLLASGALASAGYAIEEWISRPAAPSPTNPGGPLACLPLLGQPGARAAALLSDRQVTVSWRFTRYTDPLRGLPRTSQPDRPPPRSVVEGLAAGEGGGVIVFLRDRADPYAPPLPPAEEGCSSAPAPDGG